MLGETKINRMGSGNVAFQAICDEADETRQRFAECSYQFFQYRCINRSFLLLLARRITLKFSWEVREQNNCESKCYELIGRWF